MAGKKELVVVYKDEYAVDCFRKLVDAMNEEAGEGGDEITLLALSEKSWDLKKKNPPVTGKTIFIGAIKDMGALLCFIDTKYERWGIKYGFNSRYACIIADTVFVKDKARYPNPQEDLKKAVCEALSRADDWKLETEGWSLWGCSAGAYVAASFCMEEQGNKI